MKEISLYLGSIVLANILVHMFHLVTVLGITFPAGAPLIGLTFSFRDLLQQKYGKWGCCKWMGVALIITLVFNPNLALASGAAFIVAESVDWLIFTYSERPFNQRILLSNIFGVPLDSVLFVTIAFGWYWPAVWGQTIVKLTSSLVVMAFKAEVKS